MRKLTDIVGQALYEEKRKEEVLRKENLIEEELKDLLREQEALIEDPSQEDEEKPEEDDNEEEFSLTKEIEKQAEKNSPLTTKKEESKVNLDELDVGDMVFNWTGPIPKGFYPQDGRVLEKFLYPELAKAYEKKGFPFGSDADKTFNLPRREGAIVKVFETNKEKKEKKKEEEEATNNTMIAGLPTTEVGAGAGAAGPAGPMGPSGPAGIDGVDGANGVGVPTGGTTGQVLVKLSNTNYDTTWTDYVPGSGGISEELENVGFSVRANDSVTTGVKGYRAVPYNCEIINWKLVVASSEIEFSTKLTLRKTSDFQTFSEIINNEAAKPSIENETIALSSNLVDWNISIAENEFISFDVEEAINIQNIWFFLTIKRIV